MRKLALYWGLAGILGGAVAPGVTLGILTGKAIAQANSSAAFEIAAAKLFRVEVPGTDADLLEKVRAFDPGAFVRREEGVIQAGLFAEASEAKRLVDDLEFVGIPAKLVKLKGREARALRSAGDRRFRVEIRGTDADLLARARAFEPGAFIRQGEGTIQVGLFDEAAKANRVIDELEIVGIQGQLVTLGGAPVAASGTPAGQRLQVEVNGTDARLLGRVRTLEPGAFVRAGEGVIQVGQFEDAVNARQLVENLALLGVTAQVVSIKRPTANPVTSAAAVPSTNPDGTIAPGTELVFVPLELPDENRPIDVPVPPGGTTATLAPPPSLSSQQGEFYVIVPGRKRKLARIETKVRRGLNAPSIPVTLRNAPFGPHVAVGPFVRREEAEQWQARLRSEGIKKARVEHQAR